MVNNVGDGFSSLDHWISIVTNFKSPTPRLYQHNCSQILLQSVQIFDVDHVINRKMMKSVRRWMNRNFVFLKILVSRCLGIVGLLQGYSLTSKNFTKISKFSNFVQKPQFHTRAHHHQNISPPPSTPLPLSTAT